MDYPQEVIPTFDMAVNEMFFEKFQEASLEHQIQVRTYNTEKTQNMRSLNPEGENFIAFFLDFCLVGNCH